VTGATLFRTNGPAWVFHWDAGVQRYFHRTTRGSLYWIVEPCDGRGLWIAREHGEALFTCERQIGAEYIQFDDGSKFWFRRPSE